MNIYQILPKTYDVGPYERVEIFCSFCKIGCPFCFNRKLWDEKEGHPYSDKDKQLILKYLSENETGPRATIVGGEPFMLQNQAGIFQMCRDIREKFPKADLWAYSGFEWESLRQLRDIKLFDVIVCGPYKQEENDGTSLFRGSSNQYIIDVAESLKQNKRVYWLDFEGNPQGPGKYISKKISSDTELLEELIKAIRSNKAEVYKDSSEYGKGLTAAYENVLDYYEHLKKLKVGEKCVQLSPHESSTTKRMPENFSLSPEEVAAHEKNAIYIQLN